MKKVVLILILFVLGGLSFYISSCVRTDNQVRLNFAIDSIKPYVYIGDTGITHWFLRAEFIYGNPNENITIKFTGLPPRLTVSPDSAIGGPTFTQDFQFYGNYAPFGIYPASVVASSPSVGTKTYNFNLVIVQSNCAYGMDGSYTASSGCASANYNYTATITHTAPDTLIINNLGGYGLNTHTKVALNCGLDSLYIKSQNIGNGVTITGAGTFSASQLNISYSAINTPGGYNDNCATVMTKN